MSVVKGCYISMQTCKDSLIVIFCHHHKELIHVCECAGPGFCGKTAVHKLQDAENARKQLFFKVV